MKILGFDSWLGGFRNYKRLNEEFEKSNIEFKLVHISSWSGLEYKEKTYGNISTRDISKYKTIDFEKVLRQENPDAVVLLSVDVFAHKSMIRTCKRLNIRVIHLFHGIMTALSVDEKVAYSKSFFAKVRFALPRVVKYIRFIVPNYFISVIKDGFKLRDLKSFFTTGSKMFSGKNIHKAEEDSRCNLCIVFNKLDGEYAKVKYSYTDEEIKVVGCPDLYEFNFNTTLINTFSSNVNSADKVLYLDSVPYLRGIMRYEDNYQYLKSIYEILRDKNLQLVVKLHPEHKSTNFGERLKNLGIIIVDKDEMIGVIQESRYVISEATSIFQIPALMGWPVYLSQVAQFGSQNYGKMIKNYERSFYFKDFNDLGYLHDSVYDPSRWIQENTGPLPFDEFPKRVVECFLGNC